MMFHSHRRWLFAECETQTMTFEDSVSFRTERWRETLTEVFTVEIMDVHLGKMFGIVL